MYADRIGPDCAVCMTALSVGVVSRLIDGAHSEPATGGLGDHVRLILAICMVGIWPSFDRGIPAFPDAGRSA
jgi:hypothetical protein